MELDLGNVMGPQGPRGSLIYYGTAITGTSTSGTIFSGSGIANAMVDDKYLNTSTGDFYTCTTSGAPSVARWAWIVNLLGPQGNVGPAGPTGQIDENTPITFSTPSTYSAPASGNTIAVLFGKITKGLSDLFASVAAKLDSSKVIASTNITQTGYVMDGKTCSDAIAQLNDDIGALDDKIQLWAISKNVSGEASLDFKSTFNNLSSVNNRQSVFVFGNINGTPMSGVIIIFGSGVCTWSGTPSGITASMNSSGRVTVSLTHTAYDSFTMISAYKLGV